MAQIRSRSLPLNRDEARSLVQRGQPLMTSTTLLDFLDHLLRDFPDHLLLVTVTIGTLFSSASVLVEQPPLNQAVDVLYGSADCRRLACCKTWSTWGNIPDGRSDDPHLHHFLCTAIKKGAAGRPAAKPHSLLATLHNAQFGCTLLDSHSLHRDVSGPTELTRGKKEERAAFP